MKLGDSWVNEFGNICVKIDYRGCWHRYFYVLVFGMLLAYSLVIVEYLVWATIYSCAISIGLFVGLFLYYRCLHKLEKRLYMLAFEREVDAQVKKAIFRLDAKAKEVRRRVYTGGDLDLKYILVYLSNDVVLEFTFQKKEDSGLVYLELLTRGSICSDEDRLYHMQMPLIYKLIHRVSLSKREVLLVFVVVSSFLSIIYISAFVYLAESYKWWMLGIVLLFVLLAAVKGCRKELGVFGSIVCLWITFQLPIMVVLFSYLLILLMIAIPVASVVLGLFYLGILTKGAAVFVCLVLTSVIPVIAPKLVRKLLREKSILRGWGKQGSMHYVKELVLYVTTPKAFNCVFSVLYLVFLAASSFRDLQGLGYIGSKEIHSAVQSALLVYMALYTLTKDIQTSEVSSETLHDIIYGFLFAKDQKTNKEEIR